MHAGRPRLIVLVVGLDEGKHGFLGGGVPLPELAELFGWNDHGGLNCRYPFGELPGINVEAGGYGATVVLNLSAHEFGFVRLPIEVELKGDHGWVRWFTEQAWREPACQRLINGKSGRLVCYGSPVAKLGIGRI